MALAYFAIAMVDVYSKAAILTFSLWALGLTFLRRKFVPLVLPGIAARVAKSGTAPNAGSL